MEYLEIFTNMSWIAAGLLILGLIFLVIEILMPGFGFFGITGLGLLIAGVVVRIVQGLNVTQSIMLSATVVGILVVGLFLMIMGAKSGLLSGSGLFETKTTLPVNYNVAHRSERKLVGKSGKTITNLDLAGKAKIRGKVYDAVSFNSFIPANSHIKVVEIRDNKIVVRKWFE